MSGFIIDFLIEVENLNALDTRKERIDTLIANLAQSDYQFQYGKLEGVADAVRRDSSSIIFGADTPEKLIHIASTMLERAKKRAFSMVNRGISDGLKTANSTDLGKPFIEDYTLGELANLFEVVGNCGTMTYLGNCALQELRNHPHSESKEMLAVEYLHDNNRFGSQLHIYPDVVEMAYIQEHPEDFAYVKTFWNEDENL